MLKKCILFLISISIVGCHNLKEHTNNTLDAYNASLLSGNYAQATERLRRCAKSGPDKKKCIEIQKTLEKEKEREKVIKAEKQKLKDIEELRESNNPWDNLTFVMELQAGRIEKNT